MAGLGMKLIQGIFFVAAVVCIMVGIVYGIAVTAMPVGQTRTLGFGAKPIVMMVEPPNLAGFETGTVQGIISQPGHADISIPSGHYLRFGRLNFVTK